MSSRLLNRLLVLGVFPAWLTWPVAATDDVDRKDAPGHIGYALAGMMDVNGDGKNNQALIRRLIERNGGRIDAAMDEHGRLSGQLQPDTRCLLAGQVPSEPASSPEAVRNYRDIIRRAEQLGIKVVRVERLFHSGSVREPNASSAFRPRKRIAGSAY